MASLDDRLDALPMMSAAELRDGWLRAYGSPPPLLPPALLRLGLAYRWQEKKHGGVTAALQRELRRVAAGEQVAAVAPAPQIRPGTQLIREWQGRTIAVLVEEDGGFLLEGQRFASLSAIAKRVTGAHWSGPRFFGVTKHG